MADWQAVEPVVNERFKGLARMVGNTPLLAIEFTYRGKRRVLYAKYEQLNMTGSIKDRMALYILQRAYAEERISPGDTIAEATSGNTGISFAALGRALGHPVTIFMPDWMSRERVDLIHSLGARIVPVGRDQGGFLGSIRLAEEMAAQQEQRVFLPHQFSNQANVARTKAPPDRKSGCNCSPTRSRRMPLWLEWARAEPSWAWRVSALQGAVGARSSARTGGIAHAFDRSQSRPAPHSGHFG